MAGSLQHSEEHRKALTADIAHELRTPLAVQRAQVEAIIDGVYPNDQENLAKILAQNELLARLVEDLRTLALVDAGELSLNIESVDLAALAKRVTERFKAAALPRGLEVDLVGNQSVIVRGDPQRIEQILSNLVGNAIRYTPEEGSIRVSCKRQNGQAVLQVHDLVRASVKKTWSVSSIAFTAPNARAVGTKAAPV